MPRFVIELAVAVFCAAIYARTLGFELVFDDLSLLGSEGPVPAGNGLLPYRPLRYLSFLIDFNLGGGRSWVYHLNNVLLHALVAVLALRTAIGLGARRAMAVAACLAFAVHPLAVEAVAYVSGRRDLLATAFSLAAVGAWISPRPRSALAVPMVLAAAASKESGVIVIGILGLASAAGLGPSPRQAIVILGGLLAASVALLVAYGATGVTAGVFTASSFSSAGAMVVHYMGGLLWPLGLSADYPHLHGGEAGPWGGSVAATLLLVLAAALWRLRRAPKPAPLAFATAWVGTVAVLTCFVVAMNEPGADRHGYPLLVAAAVALALGLSALPARTGRAACVSLAVCTALLAALCWQQSALWRNQWTLWSGTVVSAPRSLRAHYNVAALLVQAGDPGHARSHLRRTLALDRGYAPAWLGLAYLRCVEGRPRAAATALQKARKRGAHWRDVAVVEAACKGNSSADD
ncbi:MAG: tetratricopeptide repeat protein [Deltaproteobacteria bacterium]